MDLVKDAMRMAEQDTRGALNNMQAARYLSAYDTSTLNEHCYPYASVYNYLDDSRQERLRITIRSTMYPQDDGTYGWREIARDIAALRKCFGIPKLTRSVETYQETVSNRFEGVVETSWGKLALSISTSALPPSCTVTYKSVRKTVKVAEVHCA